MPEFLLSIAANGETQKMVFIIETLFADGYLHRLLNLGGKCLIRRILGLGQQGLFDLTLHLGECRCRGWFGRD